MNAFIIVKGIFIGVVGGLIAKQVGNSPTELLWWITFLPFLIVNIMIDIYLGVYDYWLKKPKKQTSKTIKMTKD